MAENFSNLVKKKVTHVQEAQSHNQDESKNQINDLEHKEGKSIQSEHQEEKWNSIK